MKLTDLPLISVALATYNGTQYVSELLESIEAQDYPHLEIVISDDASSDGTHTLLKTRTWRHPHRLLEGNSRLGVVGNFGRAIAACHGEYIAFADQDDVWHPKKLSTMLQHATTIENAIGSNKPVLVFSDLEVVDAQLQPIASSFFDYAKKSPSCADLADFVVSNHVPGCAMLVNRALLARALPVPEEFHMHDWWFMMVAAAFGTIVHVDQALIKYRQHAQNAVGVQRNGHTWTQRLWRVMQLSAWRHFLFPSAERVRFTQRNLSLFEARYRSELPPLALQTFRDLHACACSAWHCLQFLARAKTGEGWAFSFFTLRAITHAHTASSNLVS